MSARAVSLIMPMYNEARSIDAVLVSIERQQRDGLDLELIVVDGASTDDGVARVRAWFARSGLRGTIVQNPRRAIPAALNLGLAHAREDAIVVRLDAHTCYAPDYLATIVAAFDRLPVTVACVGGAQRPASARGAFALTAALYANPLALGGAGFRVAAGMRTARAVYLGAWRPGVLQALGGWDERWRANEDGELFARLRAAGHEVCLVPAMSWYHVNRTPSAAVRQWARYGYWRAQTLRRHPHEWRARHLIAPLALASTALLALSPLRIGVPLLFVLYAAAVTFTRARGEAPWVTAASWLFFPFAQAAWSCGLVAGLVRPLAGLSTRRVPNTVRASEGVASN